MTEETKKSRKKLTKDLTEHPLVKLTVKGGNNGEMTFDFSTLPEDIQDKFGPFGLGHKLGDSAAGKSGTEAEEAINRVWDGLLAGDWTVRAPAAPKVNIKEIAENFQNLSDAEQETAKSLLASLGLDIPGVTQ